MIIDKIGQRVQIKHCPEHTGTISKIEPGHSFVITYDKRDAEGALEPRKHGEPHVRHRFSMSEAGRFVPEGSVKIRVVPDVERLDIPAALAKKYGIGEPDA